MNLPLPKETREYLGDNENRLLQSGNLGLLLNKYVSVWTDDWKTEEKKGKDKVNLKAEFLAKTARESSYVKQGRDAVESIYKRQLHVIQGLQSSGWHIESFYAATDSRLIIGLGSESVIETGMTLHPLYGFPYLPASGLKGLARAYAEIVEEASKEEILNIFGSEDKDPRKIEQDNRQGRVFFMDGLPVAFPKLDLDIMNPHYGDYYQGKTDSKGKPIPPADYLNPVPVTFLTVAEGQTFSFVVYSREKDLADKAREWLIGGLTQLGAGGKTNVGYGYFRIDPVPEKKGKQTVSAVEEDTSLASKLKTVKNGETFSDFIRNIGPDELEELKNITFEGMKSVINIGVVGVLESSEATEEVRKAIAGKMLEVIKKNKKWDERKLEKYRKLQSMAGLDHE